jgi:hypothetical protein
MNIEEQAREKQQSIRDGTFSVWHTPEQAMKMIETYEDMQERLEEKPFQSRINELKEYLKFWD